MPRKASAITVLIASPSDTGEAREKVRDEVFQWTLNTGLRRGVVALPWLYERNAVPLSGDRPQALINNQAVNDADVVVAFFNSRLGSDTGMDVSGTAEEIRHAQERGRPVHVYFSDEDRPRKLDLEQAAALEKFREELQRTVLTGSYSSAVDLAHQVTKALELDVQTNEWTTGITDSDASGLHGSPGLKWRHVRETRVNGRGKTVTARNDLVVSNPSPLDAEELTFQLSGAPLDSNGAPAMKFDGPDGPVTVHGESERSRRLIPLAAFEATIEAKWTQNGRPQQQTRTFRVAR